LKGESQLLVIVLRKRILLIPMPLQRGLSTLKQTMAVAGAASVLTNGKHKHKEKMK
jgi:hypothetical protein